MKNKINYPMISVLQFTFAILVIMLHSTRLFQNDILHFIQKSIFSRMAVPFFIVCSSFLMKVKTEQDLNYQKKYIQDYVKTYLKWSILFIPYGLFYFNSLSLSPVMIPFAILVAILYTGICYHLWYIPAFLTGLYFVDTAKKKLSLKWIIIICFILFTLGSIETYSSFLKNTQLLSYYSRYASVFFTSRNGLFFTPIFICIGYLLFEKNNSDIFTQHAFIKLIISFAFVCIEGFIIFPNQGLDKNFLFTLILFSLFLFNWAIRTDIFRNQNFSQLKSLSMYYFFLHPIFIELISIPSIEVKFNPIYFGWIKFLFALIGTHFFILGVYTVITEET